MAIPRYTGIESIEKIAPWFLKRDKSFKSKLWINTEVRNELTNSLILLFKQAKIIFKNPAALDVSEPFPTTRAAAN